MTITCRAINASSGSPAYSALQERQSLSSLIYNGTARILGGQSGTPRGREPVLSATTTWSVGPFVAVVEPQFTSSQSLYMVVNDAAVTGAVTSPDATNGRYDILYVKINDTDIDSSGSRNAQVLYLAGTPSGSPVLPSVPTRSYLLGWILVPHSGGGSPVTTNNPIWTAASGGILPVTTGTVGDALITNPVESMYRDRQDTDVLERHNGTAWFAASARSYRTAPGDYTLTASLTAMASLTLPPGIWEITGSGHYDYSTATVRTYAVDLYNNTAAAQIVTHPLAPHILAGQFPESITDVVTLTVQSVIQFRGFTSVIDGSQFFKQIRLVAVNAGQLN